MAGAGPVLLKGTPDLVYIHDVPGCDPWDEDTLSRDDFDGPFIVMPGTRFSYSAEGKIYDDLTRTPEFSRLTDIKQIGRIALEDHSMFTTQMRLGHSYICGAMMDIVLYRNHFTEHERRVGIAAGLYHDVATVPYSDQGKLLKPGSYEEESLVERVFRRSRHIKTAFAEYGLGIDEVLAAIQGRGAIGQLLNSREGMDIDNIAYVGYDQSQVRFLPDSEMHALQQQPIFDQYNEILFID